MAPPFTRRPSDARRRGRLLIILLIIIVLVAAAAYLSFPTAAGPSMVRAEADCCRGVEGLELWGPAVKWGSDHRLPSAAACCASCKAMCPHPEDGSCRCDSWVFCGDKRRCNNKFGECWLKKQKDVMAPAVIARGDDVMWTSGLVFANGEAAFGPSYALLQGTLEVDGVPFKEIGREACPWVKRGSVAWVGSGPELLISLADHREWKDAYTVFGYVLPDDMAIAEAVAVLPTSTDVWSNVTVEVLRDPVFFKVKRRSNASDV
ncbi:hypothetical protein PR202_gb18262 [Eleusine coracana subsp. coracana]|uniref:Peptidylprolyl isomerase n=1 Tax=Eleusine coracana subsp. coracana TaxID=191504 RepID=A0AAV5F4U3_ELECO|nr:hypothetical protein PR202_gb18262 [Eleusine coracana subsp. coracana]